MVGAISSKNGIVQLLMNISISTQWLKIQKIPKQEKTMKVKVDLKSESAASGAFFVDVYLDNDEFVVDVSKRYRELYNNQWVTFISIAKNIIRIIGTKKDIIEVGEQIMISHDYDHEFIKKFERAIQPMRLTRPSVSLIKYQNEY